MIVVVIPAWTRQVGGYELDPIRLKTDEGWDMQVRIQRTTRLVVVLIVRAICTHFEHDRFAKTGSGQTHKGQPLKTECGVFLFLLQDDFAFGLYDLDYDVFGCHLEAHINRVPAVGEVGIQSTVCGPESFTPDHKPLMGECPVRKRLLFVRAI